MTTSMTIPRRRLGQSGLEVPALGLGCMGMSDFYGDSDEAESLRVLNHALDIGINLLDTADMYGMGDNERLLAKLLRTRRDQAIVATKFGIARDPDGVGRRICGTPEYLRQACDASLRRLGIDHIDLYYQHRIDPNVPIEETVAAMAELVRAGKVRYLGLSEASAATLRRAVAVHPIAALQTEYSLWTRDIEAEILPACRSLGIGLVAYSPLGRGFLTGALSNPDALAQNDFRRHNPRFQPENISVNQALVNAIGDMAKARGCTPAQLALAWLLHQGQDIVPIPGTRRIARLDENAAAALIALTSEELAKVSRIIEENPVAGTRYPVEQMATLNI